MEIEVGFVEEHLGMLRRVCRIGDFRHEIGVSHLLPAEFQTNE